MKIAMYEHHSQVGGVSDMFIDQIKYSDRNAIDYVFFTEEAAGWSSALDELTSLNAPIVRVKGSVDAFKEAYRTNKIDLVHVMACGDIQDGARAAMDLNLPIVETAACVAYSGIYESGYRNLNAVYLCQSHWEAVGGRSYFLKIDGGVDLHRLDDAKDKVACKQHWGLDVGRPVVGWYGRFDQFKCPLSFPDIARFIKEKVNAQFIMFGDGPDKGHAEGLARQANVDIKFAGMTRSKGLAFGAMDIYVFSSWQEAFGRVMVEAMASGVPIITADYPVMHELCDNAALYVENARQDPLPILVSKRYADEVIKLIQHPDIIKAMGQVGLERAKLYDAKRMTKEYTSLYEKMVPNK